jgi:hypothetical protein
MVFCIEKRNLHLRIKLEESVQRRSIVRYILLTHLGFLENLPICLYVCLPACPAHDLDANRLC